MKYCSLYFKIWRDIFITAKFAVWKHIHHEKHTAASYTLDRALLGVPTEICLLGDHSRFMTVRLVIGEREGKGVNLPLLNWRIRVYLLWNLLPALRLLYGQPIGVRNVAVHRPCKSQLLSPQSPAEITFDNRSPSPLPPHVQLNIILTSSSAHCTV